MHLIILSSPRLGRAKAEVIWSNSWQYLQMGDVAAALQILALKLGKIDRAIDACGRSSDEHSHAILLDLLLRPPDGRTAMYDAACQVLAARGERLLLM